MFNILDRYIGKEIFIKIFFSFFSLIVLSEIIKFFDQLKRMEQKESLLFSLFFYALYTIPKDIGTYLPISVLLGSILGCSTLDIRNELIAMYSLGFTQYQISKSIMKVIFPVVLLVFFINEVIIPISEKSSIYLGKKERIRNSFFLKKNFWIRDKQKFIFIEKIESKNKMIGIKFFNLNSHKEVHSIILSKEAIFVKKKWKLFQIKKINFFNSYDTYNQSFLCKEWNTNLSPEIIQYSILSPNTLSIFEIHKYISYLKKTKQKIRIYQFFMWKKILSPLLLYNTVLISFNFSFDLLKFFSFKKRLFIGIFLGFLLYFLDHILILCDLENTIFSVCYIMCQNFFILLFNLVIIRKQCNSKNLIFLN